MSRTPLRACAIAALLLVAVADSRGQAISPAEAARGKASIDTQQNDRLAAQQNERIISLLEQLAEQARQSDDLNFTVRTQSQAATLLCPYDPVRARAIYRRAFQSLTLQPASRPNETTASGDKSRPNLTTAERLQLRSELLNQIAARDPELADELARTLAETSGLKDGCAGMPGGCDQISAVQSQSQAVAASTREDIERREVLMSVALRIVEREPEQAMALAQMSFTPGLSPNFSRLLMLMRTAEPGLADLLFSSAVARLERASAVDLADIHTLGSYLVSAGSSAREAMGRELVVRFLNLAFNQIARRDNSAATGAARAARRDESAAIYFIGRQLTDLFARYQPDRLEQLQYKISELTESGPPAPVIDLAAYEASSPAEMEAAALDTKDAHERDSLYARAALAWLAKDELRRAQSAASEIRDAEMRDRVLGQIARKQSAEGRIEDAVLVARRIEELSSRVDALVLASSALAAKDKQRAIELLNEAETCAAKLRPPSPVRVQSLLKVASAVSAFDASRGFEITQSAVKAINETGSQPDEHKQAGSSKTTSPGATELVPSKIAEPYTSLLETTLATLARADFERALFLAQQLSVKETSIAAQLAVCRGGLVGKPASNRTTEAAEIDATANPGR